MGKEPVINTKVECAHCGDPCPPATVPVGNLSFCCQGCQSVYEILQANNLGDFYLLDKDAGRAQRGQTARDYSWLDLDKLAGRFIRYQDDRQCHVEMELPAIHCASCVWLLERLPQLEGGIRSVKIDVTRKQAVINFDPQETSLRQVAEWLTRIGYPPHFQTHRDGEGKKMENRSLIYRIGVAGFCFGNIMLLSFPEYFGMAAAAGAGGVEGAMGYLLLALSLPVMFYAGTGFFKTAWAGLRARRVTIDVPISLGMAALFLRSLYEILSATGPGYLDSLAGLVFFLLIGRWFQSYTFARLNFDRDYRDYFPIATHRLLPNGDSEPVASEDLLAGDRILVRPGQLIPTDGTLLQDGQSGIDYSFVTGEADPRPALAGQAVFAGGRATTSVLSIKVSKTVSQSYLLQLWQESGEKTDDNNVQPAEGLIRYFTAGVLLLAAVTFGYWWAEDSSLAYRAATAVLIIACPCALALAAPFAYGSLQRLFGRAGCYLRGPGVITRMAEVNTFVFDKTGTLVGEGEQQPLTLLSEVTDDQWAVFRQMAESSSHPKSLALLREIGNLSPPTESAAQLTPLRGRGAMENAARFPCQEHIGAGLSLSQSGDEYRIGKASFCGLGEDDGRTYACWNGKALLALEPAAIHLRPGADKLLAQLRKRGSVYLLSGDQAPQTDFWSDHFPAENVHFNMSPFDKQAFIHRLQSAGDKVLMVGDGLNDAGALAAADVGLAISDEEARFSPACDGILTGSRIGGLNKLLSTCGRARIVLWLTYGIAFLYNAIGLSYAVTGTLSPVVAAILMPLSSITVVLVASLGASLIYRWEAA
ncbi:heavy metal translocating P-type ATPase [Neolewinella agarilytica]|uniref:Cu+-exporting ATPase n=1 Tax=Neolewinella agarilytica TaxID=478744 RepID=A0A1H9EQQ2_9BACT|nr:heavy metal translocating P-type ATPase metal-binding domain-containing protein [Neolewinella agarilytica]SEQ27533.1 Cu+-exporting ATPase [Neolewinella agarilytica]